MTDQAAAAGQATAFDFRSVIGADGNFVEGWLAKLPEDVRKELGDTKYFDAIKDPVSLVKSTHGLSKLAGRVLVPGSDAAPEEWQNVFSHAPMPKQGEGYKLSLEGVKDERLRKLLGDRKATERLDRIFGQAGIPLPLAGPLATAWLAEAADDRRIMDEHIADHRTRLETAYGGKEGYEKMSQAGLKALATLYGAGADGGESPAQELLTLLEAVNISDHPLVVELLGAVAKLISPGTITAGGGPSTGSVGKTGIAAVLPATAKVLGIK